MSRKSKGKNRNRPLPVPGAAPVNAPKENASPAKAEPRKPSHGKRSMRVNKRFLFTTLVAAVCVGVSVHLVHGYFTQSNAAQLLVRGWDADKADRADDAIQLYTQFLQLVDYEDADAEAVVAANGGRPFEGPLTTPEILGRIGVMLDEGEESNGRLLRAYRTYEEILRRDPDNTDIRRRAVTMAMRFGRFRDAFTHLKRLMPENRADGTPAHAATARLAAQCLAYLGKYKADAAGLSDPKQSQKFLPSEDAQTAALRAIECDPKDMPSHLLLASLWLQHPRDAEIRAAGELQCLQTFVGPVSQQGVDPHIATAAAYRLLDAMVEHAENTPRALLRQAGFLLEAVPPEERDPAPQPIAEAETRELLEKLDANQDGVLDLQEFDPANQELDSDALRAVQSLWLVDANRDDQLAREEILERKLRGDRLTRLAAAARSIESVLTSDGAGETSAALKSRAMLLGVDVYQALAEALTAGNVAEVEELDSGGWKLKADVLAADGRALGHNPQFHTLSAQLELRRLGSGEAQSRSDQLQALEKAVEFLDIGLSRIAEKLALQGDGETKAPRPDYWSDVDNDELPLEAIRDDQQWQLANVLQIMSVIDPDHEFTRARASTTARAAADKEWEVLDKVVAPKSRIPGFDDRVKLIEARRLMADGKWLAARTILERLRSAFSTGSPLWRNVIVQLASCYEQMGNPDARLDLYRVALASDPLWVEGAIGEAEGLLQVGRVDDAMRKLGRYAGLPQVAERLARLDLVKQASLPADRRRYEVAERLLKVAPAKRDETLQAAAGVPHARAALIADLCIHEAALKWELAAGDESQRPGVIDLLDTAQDVLAASRDARPADAETWATLALSAARRFDAEPAERLRRSQEVLREATEKNGDSGALRIAAALVASLQPAESAVELLGGLDQDIGAFEDDEQYRLHELMATAYARAGDLGRAIQSWKSAAAVRETDYRPHAAILQLALAQASEEGGGSTVDGTLWNEHANELDKLEGGTGDQPGPLMAAFRSQRRIAEIARDAALVKDADARKQQLQGPQAWLAAAAKQRPYWSSVPKLQSLIADLNGQPALAAEFLERAYELGDRSERVVFSLLSYYRSQAQTEKPAVRQSYLDKAERMLEEITHEDPGLLTGDVGRMASDLYWQRGQFDEAIGLRKRISESSKNPEDKIHLATQKYNAILRKPELTHEQREQELAAVETLLKDATVLGPASPKVWIALVQYYALAARQADAEKAVSDAAASLPAEPPHLRPMTLGWCHELIAAIRGLAAEEVMKLRGLALAQYEAALATDPTSPDLQFALAQFHVRTSEPGKALELFDKVLEGDTELSPAGRAQLRITRALTVASSGKRPDTELALKSLREEEWPDERWKVQGLRAQASIIDRRNGPGDGRALVKLLEEIERVSDLDAKEQFLLARLYDSTGNWPESKRVWLALLQDHPTEAVILAEYARGLIQHDELEEAEAILERLELVLPDQFVVSALRAQLLHAQERTDEAAVLLLDELKDLVPISNDGALGILLRGTDSEQAVRVIEEYLQTHRNEIPAEELARAEAALAAGNPTEAIETLGPAFRQQVAEAALSEMNYRMALRLLESFERLDLAETVCREFMSATGSRREALVLAPIVAKQGRIDEALDLCESTEGVALPQAIANVSVNILRAGEATAAQFDRVDRFILKAMQEKPDSLFLELELAMLRDLQGRYDEAVTIYQGIVAKRPAALLPLNNLAWLLAIQGRNLKEAMAMIDSAIQSAGPSPEMLDTRATIHLALGDSEKAIRDLQIAVSDKPTADKYWRLASAYWRAGNRDEAARAFQEGRRLGLTQKALHPLEQKAFMDLIAQLDERL